MWARNVTLSKEIIVILNCQIRENIKRAHQMSFCYHLAKYCSWHDDDYYHLQKEYMLPVQTSC